MYHIYIIVYGSHIDIILVKAIMCARTPMHTYMHRAAHTHTHICARARSLSLSLSLIPALTRTNTHAFVHIFISACMNAPMCMVRMCRYKRECEHFIYTHVFVCIYTHGHTQTHMYIQYVHMHAVHERIRVRACPYPVFECGIGAKQQQLRYRIAKYKIIKITALQGWM